MRKSFFLWLIPLFAWSFPYDSNLLLLGAKLFPKIILMEKSTAGHIQSTVHLVIVASPSNYDSAQRFSELIEHQYGGALSSYRLKTSLVSPKEALQILDPNAFVLFVEPTETLLPSLIEYANKNKILTFSVDSSLLKRGTAVSLYIGRSVKPYINLSTIKQVPFTFEYGFLKLSQPYE